MMRLAALLMLLPLLCVSCAALPAEERAFAVALCVEKAGCEWRVHGRIPTYQSGGGYLTVTGTGNSLTAALSDMEAGAPMRLHLSQLRLLVLKEEMAHSADLHTALNGLAKRPDMRLECAVALSGEPMKNVADSLKPATGARLSKAIDVMLESRTEQGVILTAVLGEVIRMGERQSPVLMNLSLKEGEISLSGGYALTEDLRFADRLTAEETFLLSLLKGQTGDLSLLLPEGAAEVREGRVSVTLAEHAPLAEVQMTLHVTSSEMTAAVLEQSVADVSAVLLSRLSAAGCDVLGLGRQAIVHAQDLAHWQAMNWSERLRKMGWQITVSAEGAA